MHSPNPADLPGAGLGRSGFVASESVWSSRTQWGAILAGSFAGIVVVILMGTLGAALGITAGAIGVAQTETATADTAEKAASAFTIGAAVWILLTALLTGLIGGWALNATARRDRPYSSVLFGGLSWAVGLCVLLAVASPAIGGAASGIGTGAAAVMTGQAEGWGAMIPRVQKESPAPAPSSRSDAAPAQPRTPMSDQEKALAKDAAEKASAAASGAAWVLLGSQLISIAATIFAAGWNRHTGARVVTEIRPRPAPTA
ncbi:MAG TPA: hypothetical protein VKW04_13375 [Planctomycetota bacterium]|nr:hypothetical protein [Planctomycetota bacterium]